MVIGSTKGWMIQISAPWSTHRLICSVVNGGHAPSMEHIAGQDPVVPHLKELNGDKARTHDEVFPPRYGEAGQKHQTESKNGKARSFS